MYMIAVKGVGGWEKPFMYNVLDTKGGRSGRGFPPPTVEILCVEIWVLNTGFWMRYKSLINIKS